MSGANSSFGNLQDNEAAEVRHWEDVMRAMLLYSDFMGKRIMRKQEHLNRLPQTAIDRLPSITFDLLKYMEECIRINQEFFTAIVGFQDYNFAPREDRHRLPNKYYGNIIPSSQMQRNHAVLHSVAREWSSEGKVERDATFQPLLEELKLRKPPSPHSFPKVLCPGSGVGRLPLEVAGAGYCSQGNEFSVFMAICGHFVLNGIFEMNSYEICPWVDREYNIVNAMDPYRSIRIPDVVAADILGGAESDGDSDFPRFSMAAGDFADIYRAKEFIGFWDAVLTCFFIDTAPVVLDYIQVIHQILQPGGVWINIGIQHYSCGMLSPLNFHRTLALSLGERGEHG